MSTTADDFLRGLQERYDKAAAEEERLLRKFNEARRALGEAKENKELYAKALRAEGITPETSRGARKAAKPSIPQTVTVTQDSFPMDSGMATRMPQTNGFDPISNTHAVHLLMKAHHNVGFTPEELSDLSKDAGYLLSPEDIVKVCWRQYSKGMMERAAKGKFRLTLEGEKFSGFRHQKTKRVA